MNRALFEAMEENVASMAHTIQSQETKITRLNVELEQARKQVPMPIINTSHFLQHHDMCSTNIKGPLCSAMKALYQSGRFRGILHQISRIFG